MASERGLLERITTEGGKVLTQLSAELLARPGVAKALEGAGRGRARIEQALARALGRFQLATQAELRRTTARIGALEREVSELRSRLRSRPGGGRSKAVGRAKTAGRTPAKGRRLKSSPASRRAR